jgi:hypothetical protein
LNIERTVRHAAKASRRDDSEPVGDAVINYRQTIDHSGKYFLNFLWFIDDKT